MQQLVRALFSLLLWLAAATGHAQATAPSKPWLVELEAGRGYTFYEGRQSHDEGPTGNGGAFALGALVGWQLSPRWLVHASAFSSLSPDASADLGAEYDKRKAFMGLYAALFGATYTSAWGPYVGVGLGPAHLQASNLSVTGADKPVGAAWLLRAGYTYPLTDRFRVGIEGRALAAHTSLSLQNDGFRAFHGSGLLTFGVRFGSAAEVSQ